MAPPPAAGAAATQRTDWNRPAGNDDFLALRNPALLRRENYARGLKETYDDWFRRADQVPLMIKQLQGRDFPERRPGVVVGASGPQGNVVPLTIIVDPADWKAASWVGREQEYTYWLTESDKAEIDAAIQGLHARGLSTEEDLKGLTKEDFPLPTFGVRLVELGLNVSHGRGFQLIKGFPIDKYRKDQFGLVAFFWAIGVHLGRHQVTQNDYTPESGKVDGSLLNHIVNFGYKVVDGVRQVHSGNRLPFHADQGATDLVALMCLSPAMEGGASKWVSAVAVHNELLRRGRKDLVEVLSQPFKLPKMVTQALPFKNEQGQTEYEDITPFEYHNGYLSVYFQCLQYLSVEKDGLELTPLQKEAIWSVIMIAEQPEFHFTHTLQPGDIEIIHNPSIFHGRDPYIDGIEDHQKRHLIRWWVHSDANRRPIAPSFAPRSSIQAGGGFKVPPGTHLRLPIWPIGLNRNA